MLRRLRHFIDADVAVLAILAAAVSVSAFDYALDRQLQPARIREHTEIIRDNGFAPNRYRVLVPFAVEPLIELASTVVSRDEAFRLTYAAVYAIGLWILAIALFQYVRRWFSRDQALVGVLLVACTLPMGLRYHTFAPWSIAEPILLTLALIAIRDERDAFVVPLTVAAALNRETGMLVPLALLLEGVRVRPRWNRRVRLAVFCIGLASAIVVGLRLWRGNIRAVVTVADVWRMNLSGQGIKTSVPAVTLLLGGTGWVFAALGFRRAPPFVRRSAWLIVFYVPLYVVFGYWYEVRLLMTLYPVFTPLLLAGVYSPLPDRRLAHDSRDRDRAGFREVDEIGEVP